MCPGGVNIDEASCLTLWPRLTPLHMLYDVSRRLQLRVALCLQLQQLLQPLVNDLGGGA
jgi:hypothetical protein